MKNISEAELNITPEELTERFTRGDASRTTEGSGLGLSIAKSLTELQGGIFDLYLNGDLFQATVRFKLAEEEEPEEGFDEIPEEEMGEDEDEPESFGEETEDDLEFLDGESFASGTADGEDSDPGLVGEPDEDEAEREARFLQEALEELESSGLRWRNKGPKAGE